jgi:hypothetical protein
LAKTPSPGQWKSIHNLSFFNSLLPEKKTITIIGDIRMANKKSIPVILVHLVLLVIIALANVPLFKTGTALAAAPASSKVTGANLAPASPQALTYTIALSVFSARAEAKWGAPLGTENPPGIAKGTAVSQYHFIINEDNTGTPAQSRMPDCYPYLDPPTNTVVNPNYPANCDWPSIHAQQGYSSIITQGDETLLSSANTLTLPAGKYLISVLADDFKIDGQWFTIPMEESVPGSGFGIVSVGVLPSVCGCLRIFPP